MDLIESLIEADRKTRPNLPTISEEMAIKKLNEYEKSINKKIKRI